MKYIIILFALFVAAPAAAQFPIRAHVVLVGGVDSLPREELPTVWYEGREHLNRTGLSVKATRLTQMYEIAPQLATLSSRKTQLYAWKKYARKNKFHRGVDVVHIILPPIYEGGLNWFAGIANGICQSGTEAISLSNAGYDTAGNLRLLASSIGIAHEMAHVLGAGHTETNDLMNTRALELVKTIYPLPVAATTIKGIKKCQQKRKARRVQRRAAKAANL